MPCLLDRDVEILRAFHRFENPEDVARAVGLSHQYLLNLMVYIREELGVRTTLGAVMKAHRLGLVPIGSEEP